MSSGSDGTMGLAHDREGAPRSGMRSAAPLLRLASRTPPTVKVRFANARRCEDAPGPPLPPPPPPPPPSHAAAAALYCVIFSCRGSSRSALRSRAGANAIVNANGSQCQCRRGYRTAARLPCSRADGQNPLTASFVVIARGLLVRARACLSSVLRPTASSTAPSTPMHSTHTMKPLSCRQHHVMPRGRGCSHAQRHSAHGSRMYGWLVAALAPSHARARVITARGRGKTWRMWQLFKTHSYWRLYSDGGGPRTCSQAAACGADSNRECSGLWPHHDPNDHSAVSDTQWCQQ